MLGVGILTPLLPLYAQNMGATGTQLGMIFAAYGISNSIFTPIMGRISAYNGRKIYWKDVMEGKLKDYSIVPELDWDKEYPNRPVPVPGKVGAGNIPELQK